nr:hypothetical protein [Bosea sp. (in: a-proteobacteria)]
MLPSIEIGDGSTVAAGSVVAGNVPPRSIVAGHPAVIILSDIEIEAYGRLVRR